MRLETNDLSTDAPFQALLQHYQHLDNISERMLWDAAVTLIIHEAHACSCDERLPTDVREAYAWLKDLVSVKAASAPIGFSQAAT